MTYQDLTVGGNSVVNNLCQGSAGHGFALGFIPCDSLSTPPYENNTVGSADIGFIFQKIPGSCQSANGVKAYACQIGQISGAAPTDLMIFQNFMIADSGRGISLKFGG